MYNVIFHLPVRQEGNFKTLTMISSTVLAQAVLLQKKSGATSTLRRTVTKTNE
jgi:hypothetical protein